jgi:anti-sigma B factor antagonist
MHIDEKNIGTVSVITPRGDMWASGGWDVHELVKDKVDEKRVHVVINLENIERINSMAIGMLVSCLKSLRDANGDLRLANANKQVQDVLKLVNLYTVLNLHDSEEDAVAGFNPPEIH